MNIFRVVETVEDPCRENRQIVNIKSCKTLSTAYAAVAEWANLLLRKDHNHLVKIADGHYSILAYPETGPDDVYDCWIEEDVLYE